MSSICGMGNPLMDVILTGSVLDLEALSAEPGSMNLVSFETQTEVIARCRQVSYLPGGSCANTMRAVAWLAARAAAAAAAEISLDVGFIGAVGNDTEGDRFGDMLQEAGVRPLLVRKTVPTGSSAIVVTPDLERTMFTFLGACRELHLADVDLALIRRSTVFHLTGYMWDTPNQQLAAHEAALAARGGGALVSFDVADPFVAERYGTDLRHWIPKHCDILFANRAELRSLTGEGGDDAAVLDAAEQFASQVVMKTGAEGVKVRAGRVTVEVPGERAQAVDTTGAGDSFAGGYLFGVVQGWPVERCARLANRLAARIVTVEGCRYDLIPAEFVIQDAPD